MREAVGSLLWLSIMTRPDITDTVRAVARYVYTSTEKLWQAIIKLLSYLNGTKSFGITYVRRSCLELEVYAGHRISVRVFSVGRAARIYFQ